MPIYEHMQAWGGKPIVEWNLGAPLESPQQSAYVIRLTWTEAEEEHVKLTSRLAAFLDMPGADQITSLVIGYWGAVDEPSDDVVEMLVAARDRLPNLTALFMGDVVMEESEISWMEQSDMAPLFTAYPRLTHFGVRGGNGLSLGVNRHDHLQRLVIETGGLGSDVLHEIWKSEFPALEHLEIWLGDENYGWDGTLADLTPLLNGTLFPRLRYLGLRNSEIADQIAQAIIAGPLLDRLEVLDLSLGTLSDTGAQALATSPAVRRLKKLDLHHHYCSDKMVQQLQRLGIEVDVSDQEDAEDDEDSRYVAVGE
jgi:hypothetical protein